MSSLLSFPLYTALTWFIIHLLYSTLPKFRFYASLQGFSLTLSTQKFNVIFSKLGLLYSKFLLIWFNIGIIIGVLSMFIGWLGIWAISWKLLGSLVKRLSRHFVNNLIVEGYSMLAWSKSGNGTEGGGGGASSGDNSAVIVPLVSSSRILV